VEIVGIFFTREVPAALAAAVEELWLRATCTPFTRDLTVSTSDCLSDFNNPLAEAFVSPVDVVG
jgi:hypothetical protein